MKIISAYDSKIMNGIDENGVVVSLNKKVLDNTLSVCRKALEFVISVANNHYDDWRSLDSLERVNFIEKKIHKTRKNNPEYDFDQKFYKFPSYMRRSVISEAVGIVSSYRSNLRNWENGGKEGKTPVLTSEHVWHPTFYRCKPKSDGGDLKVTDRLTCSIRVFKDNDWKWMDIMLKNQDIRYMERHCANRKALSPSLKKSHGDYYLTWVFQETKALTDKAPLNCTICAVDMGILTDATCCIMDKSGTVCARKFINFAYEKDQINHLCNRIRGNQANGQSVRNLWKYARNFNTELSRKVSNAIVDFAILNNADIIVFEHLDTRGKKKGGRKQKLHLWKHQEIQDLTEYRAHRYGMRVSRICAWNTSRLAFDGSGAVKRGQAISDNMPYDICQFTSGKIYNCDLCASYNIGARFFLREINKLFPDYSMPVSTQRTLSDLRKASSELADRL